MDRADSVVQTGDGGYAIAGYTYSFGAGGSDSWLVKIDTDGNVQWNKTYGGTSFELAMSVIQTSEGGYAMAGGTYSSGAGNSDFWLVKTDATGNMQCASMHALLSPKWSGDLVTRCFRRNLRPNVSKTNN